MFNLKAAFILAALAALVACTATQPQTFPGNADIGVVVSVKQPDTAFPPGSSFTWVEAESSFDQDPRLDSASLQEMFHEAIINRLDARGYQVAERDGDYLLSYVAALTDNLSDIELTERFGINPGMVGDSHDKDAYEKATVVIDIKDKTGQTVLWRAALQGFAVFGLDDEERRARVNDAVRQLFTTLP